MGKGIVLLNVEGTGIVAFTEVLYFSQFEKANLLLVSRLAQKGVILTFRDNHVELKLMSRIIATGTLN